MSNGPMGGFMPTPAAPAQPPTVKLDTTALSRGNFNNFLKNMSGASSLNPPMAPQMGAMMSPSLAPSISDIDIFNPPMQMMQQGGNVAPRQTEIMGQPHMLAYITPQESDILEGLGGANEPGPMGIPSFFVDDFGDFSSVGDDAPSVGGDDGGGFSDDSQSTDSGGESIVGDDPIADLDFNVVTTPTVTEQEQQQNIQDAEDFITGTTQYPSPQNFGKPLPKINFTNKTIEDAFNNLNVPQKTRAELEADLKDRAKNNDLIGALDAYQKDSAEFDKTSLGEQVLNNIIQASGVNPAEFSRKAFNQGDILGDKDIQDALNLTKSQVDEGFLPVGEFDVRPSIDPFKIEAPAFNPSMAGLPTVKSTRSTVAEDQARALANLVGNRTPTIGEQLQQNILEERGRALGPNIFSDDLANFAQNERSRGFDEISRVGDDFDTALDIVDRREKDQAVQNLLDSGQRAQDIKNIQSALDRDILSQTLDQTTPTTTTSTLPEDFEENVGLPFDAKRMADIERLYNRNVGQAGYGTGPIPNFRDTTKFQEGQDPTFFEGKGFTGTAGGILDAIERKSRENMATELALGRPMTLGETIFGFDAPNIGMGKTKATDKETIQQYNERTGRSIPENQLVRNDSGRVIGIRDASGRLVSGMDPNEKIQGGDDSGSPIIRPTVPRKEEEDKPSTNIGMMGGANPFLPSQSPVIVDSPFTTNVGDFQGTGFSTGDLNRLIAQLTGIRSPRSMAKGGVTKFANGGLIKAVDDFLSSGQ